MIKVQKKSDCVGEAHAIAKALYFWIKQDHVYSRCGDVQKFKILPEEITAVA